MKKLKLPLKFWIGLLIIIHIAPVACFGIWVADGEWVKYPWHVPILSGYILDAFGLGIALILWMGVKGFDLVIKSLND